MPRCPTCKESVSAFAAGCSHCGTDLMAARRAAEAKRARRPSLPGLPRVRVHEDVATLALITLVVIASPVFGLLLVGFALYRERLSAQRPLRVSLTVVGVVALLFLALPETRYGVLGALLGWE